MLAADTATNVAKRQRPLNRPVPYTLRSIYKYVYFQVYMYMYTSYVKVTDTRNRQTDRRMGWPLLQPLDNTSRFSLAALGTLMRPSCTIATDFGEIGCGRHEA